MGQQQKQQEPRLREQDLTKATKGATTKEDTTRAKEKATQGPKAMDQTKATKAKETTAKQKDKEGSNNYMKCHRCGKRGHWAKDCLARRRRRRTTSTRPRTSRTTPGSERHLGLVLRKRRRTWTNYMEETWNDYDYDNSWDLGLKQK